MTMLTSMLRSAESVQPDLNKISIGNAGIVALLGYAMVFVGILALLAVVVIISKFFTVKTEKKAPVVSAEPVSAPEPAPTAVEIPAPGSAGTVKTYDVPPKTCAMLMAIVADKMGKPLNELRFISIKEVK